MGYCNTCGIALSSGILCQLCGQSANPEPEPEPQVVNKLTDPGMPYCTRCGDAIGEGLHCSSCNSMQEEAQPDTQARNNNTPTQQADAPRFTPFPASASDNKIVLISPQSNSIIPYNGPYGPSDLLHAMSALHLASDLTVTKTENNMTWNMTYNKERVQCDVCKRWFAGETERTLHWNTYNAWCGKHGQCFGLDDQYYHAEKYRHSRCFVKGCREKYRKRGGWGNEVIKQHVEAAHCPFPLEGGE